MSLSDASEDPLSIDEETLANLLESIKFESTNTHQDVNMNENQDENNENLDRISNNEFSVKEVEIGFNQTDDGDEIENENENENNNLNESQQNQHQNGDGDFGINILNEHLLNEDFLFQGDGQGDLESFNSFLEDSSNSTLPSPHQELNVHNIDPLNQSDYITKLNEELLKQENDLGENENENEFEIDEKEEPDQDRNGNGNENENENENESEEVMENQDEDTNENENENGNGNGKEEEEEEEKEENVIDQKFLKLPSLNNSIEEVVREEEGQEEQDQKVKNEIQIPTIEELDSISVNQTNVIFQRQEFNSHSFVLQFDSNSKPLNEEIPSNSFGEFEKYIESLGREFQTNLENEKLTTELQKERKELLQSKETIEKLNEEKLSLLNQIEKLKIENEEKEQTLQKYELTINQQNDAIQNEKSLNFSLTKQLRSNLQENTNTEQFQEISNLKQENHDLKDQVSSLTERIQSLESEKESFLKKLQDVKENLKITEDTLLQYKNINSDLEKQLNDLAQMNTKEPINLSKEKEKIHGKNENLEKQLLIMEEVMASLNQKSLLKVTDQRMTLENGNPYLNQNNHNDDDFKREQSLWAKQLGELEKSKNKEIEDLHSKLQSIESLYQGKLREECEKSLSLTSALQEVDQTLIQKEVDLQECMRKINHLENVIVKMKKFHQIEVEKKREEISHFKNEIEEILKVVAILKSKSPE